MFEQNESKQEERDLVWVPKSIATKIRDSESYKAQSNIVDDLIESEKRSWKSNILQLDDDLALFKAASVKFRVMLDEVVSSQEEELERLYNRSCELHDGINKRAKEIVSQLKPVEDQIDTLQGKIDRVTKLCNDLPVYRIEEFINLVDKLSNMDTKRFEVLAKLCEVNNYDRFQCY